MLDKVIHFSIHNKIIVGLFTLALLIWGGYSLTQLPIDAVPDITNNQVQLITLSPTLAAQEVERFITYPVEIAMANLPDLVEIRSISRFGLSVVTIVFEDDVDVYLARQMVGERLREAESQIPPGLGSPELAPVSTGLGEIYQYVIHPQPGYEKKYTATDLRTIQDWIVRRQLLGTPGVADVSSFGGFLKQYEVAANPEKLRSLGITLSDLFTALEQNNENTGGAYIDKKPNNYFIRGIGLVGSLNDIGKIVVKNNAVGIPILIRDVATVQFGSAVRYGALTRNDQGEAVGALVLMLKGANANQVIQNVKERMAVIQKTLPDGITVEPFLDRSALVGRAIGTVTKNLIEGGLIVIFVLVLFLGNLRAGLVVASVIPLAMLFAIAMMNLFGVSGNLMSLGAIDFGLIVDGAVIIVEATLHHIVGKKYAQPLTQDQMDAEVYESASKIRTSAAFGEIIILIVYLPILALVGVEGKMFKPMAQTVAFAILGAFILSLTYVPMVSALFLSKQPAHKRNLSDRMMDFFHRVYDPFITFALKRKITILLATLTLFVGSLWIFLGMGGEFLPNLSEGDFAVEVRLMPGASLSQTVETVTKVSGILMKQFPEAKEVVGKIGAGEIPTDPMPIEATDLMVILKDQDEWTSAGSREELANKMSEALEVIPGVEFGFQQPIQMRFNELISGARQDVAIKVFGEDLDQLAGLAKGVQAIIQPVKGVQDIYVEKVTGLPQIQVEYSRDKMAQYGLTVSDVNRVLRTAFAGEKAGVIFEGEKRFDLVVRLGEDFRQSLEDVRAVYVSLPSGGQVPLEQVADIRFEEGPMQISREDTKRRITIGFNVRGRDVESIVEEIEGKLGRDLKLPAGYYITYGGQFENLVEAKERLSIAVPIALSLIMLLLYFTFHSVKQTFLIFSAIPLSAIGGVLALWLRGMPFSISAGIGFIALFGVAVLNGIVLIGYFNQLKAEGLQDVYDRVLEGTKVRLRPVLMTATVASLGFLPMALSTSAGAEVQKPLATVVIGGLVSATLLTLIVLPVLYVFSEKGWRAVRDVPGKRLARGAAILLLLACWLGPAPARSQVLPVRRLTLEQAIGEAQRNNAGIRSSNYAIDVNQALRKTSTDLGRTSITLLRGQYNSLNTDNNFTITQNIPFPTTWTSQARLARANVRSSELNLAVTENVLANQVKSAYYQLAFLQARAGLLMRQDSLMTRFARAAGIRYRTGETSLLENATAQLQLNQTSNLIVQNQADVRIYQQVLQTLLNSGEPIGIADTVLTKRALSLALDSSLLAQNPSLAYQRQQVEVSGRSKEVEKARLLPDFTLGYFNQSLTGIQSVGGQEQYFGPDKRFTGFQVGISLPLWFRPQAARIQAAALNQKLAQSDFELARKNLAGQLAQAGQEYLKYRSSLDYYEQNALPQAELILEKAQKAFQSGEIGYVEFTQGINSALGIRSSYLDILNQYNQSVLALELLAGIR